MLHWTIIEHYCCVKYYIPSTNAIQNVDTIKFYTTQTPISYITPDNYLNQLSIYIHFNSNKTLSKIVYNKKVLVSLVKDIYLLPISIILYGYISRYLEHQLSHHDQFICIEFLPLKTRQSHITLNVTLQVVLP